MRLVSAVFNFLIVVVLSKYFGATIKGEATLLLTNISFFVLFSGVIGGNSLFVLHSDFSPRLLLLGSFFWAVIVSGIGFVLIVLSGAFTLEICIHTAILSILFSFLQVTLNFLLAQKKYKAYNLLTVFPVGVTFLMLILGSYFFEDRLIATYITALYIAYFIALIIAFFVLDKPYFYQNNSIANTANFRHVFMQGIAFQFTDILLLLNFRLYFYLLNFFQSTSDLGRYSTGISILEIAWLLSRSFFTFTLSENSSNIHLYHKKIRKYLPLAIVASLLYICVLYLIPKSVYAAIFGEGFREVVYMVKWSVPGVIIFNVFICLQAYFLQQKTYSKIWLALLLGIITQILVCTQLIHHYYYSGASAAASAGFIIATIVISYYFLSAKKNQL